MGPLAMAGIALGGQLLGGLMGGKKGSQGQSPAYQALVDSRARRMTEETALANLQRFATAGDIQPEPWWAGGADIWKRNRGQA